MTTLIRTEVIRLRTLRSTYGVLFAILALGALITIASMADAGEKGFTTADQLREPIIATAGIVVAVGLAMLAAARVAGEYRYGTIAQRLLATPRRPRMFISTAIVYGVLASVTALVTLALTIGLAQPQLASEGLSLGLSSAALAELAGSVALGAAVFAVLGAGAGVICRSQAAGIVAIVAVFVAEKLIPLVNADVATYMPFEELNALLGIGGGTSRGVAAIVLTVTAVAVAGVAGALLARRDVT